MNYWDKHGRLHHKPVTDSNPYPSNNSFLYSGEYSLLAPVNELSIAQCWADCQTTPYGYDRNPNGESIPASSHDEVVGVFMLSSSTDNSKNYFDKLQSQFFQVCNLPNFTPTPLYKLNPFKVIRDLYKLNKEESPRKSTYKYPYIFPITFRHQSQHTYFYKRCAALSPSLGHSLFFFLSTLTTIFRGDNSGKTMLGFKLLKLKKLGLSFTEKVLLTIYNKYVNFGEEVYQYFPSDHPIVEKVNEKTKI